MGSVAALVANELIVLGGAATQPPGQLFKSLSTATLSDAGAMVLSSTLTATSLICTANVGTVGSGVTAIEYGDGVNHTTHLTIAKVNAFTVADNAALADGHLIYTFPAGNILVCSALFDLAITAAEDTTATPDVGLGTVIGSGAVATLDGTGTFEDIITGQTFGDAAGTYKEAAAGPTAGAPFGILSAAAHTIHVNMADTWADTAGTDLTADLAGTVVLNWKFLA